MEIWSQEPHNDHRFVQVRDGEIYDGERCIGVHFLVNDSNFDEINSYVGIVDWILLDCLSWKMIPIENAVSLLKNSPTKLCAMIRKPSQIQGAAYALQTGVDAVCVESNCFEEAMRVQKEKFSTNMPAQPLQDSNDVELEEVRIVDVETGGIGERICVDFTRELSIGEGILVGSTANSLILVHSESIPSQFVPTRPFRVNAGAVHTYTLLSNGQTKYLQELIAGDEIMTISSTGRLKTAVIGRIKQEHRPMLILRWMNQNGIKSQTFLQQAETVRVVGVDGEPMSVTEITKDAQIMGYNAFKGRHLGRKIDASVEEW